MLEVGSCGTEGKSGAVKAKMEKISELEGQKISTRHHRKHLAGEGY